MNVFGWSVTLCAGIQEVGGEILTLENLFHNIISIHSSVVHPLELRLHGVLLHWMSAGGSMGSDRLTLDS